MTLRKDLIFAFCQIQSSKDSFQNQASHTTGEYGQKDSHIILYRFETNQIICTQPIRKRSSSKYRVYSYSCVTAFGSNIKAKILFYSIVSVMLILSYLTIRCNPLPVNQCRKWSHKKEPFIQFFSLQAQ